ncbi:MAG: FkbM family methyltransferase [Candidatus Methanoperedens sp.]|nr:FkbM family methyltransferase [Candidatus Methanoperedens sp.]CAG0969612.1 hypothetical protein METP1_01160 [Methanosarcinales archaeon]
MKSYILWLGNLLLGQRYTDYYFLKMNLINDGYIKRRQFKELIQKLIDLHNRQKLNEIIIRNGDVIIVTEPYNIQYYYHPEIDIDNSGENFDVMFQSTKRDKYLLDYIVSKTNHQSTFIDVGANLGHFSLNIAKRTHCTCYAFEPLPINIRNLKANVELNALKNIVIVPVALGENKGSSYFSTNLQTQANRLVKVRDSSSIEVQCTTLDDFVYENKIGRVDFIKVDIQGAEFLFLKGAEKTINQFKPIIVLESDDLSLQFEYKRKEMFQWLYDRSYVLDNSINNNEDFIFNYKIE